MSRLICEVISGPSIEEAERQITAAQGDCVELRLDLFSPRDIPSLQELKTRCPLAMIFTMRCRLQGGGYTQSEEMRLKEMAKLVQACRPEYLDLESHVPPEVVQAFALRYPDMKILISWHDFTSTPEDLDSLFLSIQRKGASLYKIAVTAKNSTEALSFLAWAKSKPVIAISMGPFGQISRILAKPITYACSDEQHKTAPGQLTVHELSNYSGSHLYGLIGNPVEKSISHGTHNKVMRDFHLNALYVKMEVQERELREVLYLAKQLGFCGLSVTMPLKEAVIPYLDHIDPEARSIGAVNTLLFANGGISGYNTDGKGALNALEKSTPVANRRLVILGAGGAAKAIAYEAKKRGALVTILNRDEEKALYIAASLSCRGAGLHKLDTLCKEGYDIIINGTPLPLPCRPDQILPSTFVMDINTLPTESLFLCHAQERNCKIIYGWQMFAQQAALQFALWFPGKIDPDTFVQTIASEIDACWAS